jgi:hypothetical protein
MEARETPESKVENKIQAVKSQPINQTETQINRCIFKIEQAHEEATLIQYIFKLDA